jgi:hypothetical protein
MGDPGSATSLVPLFQQFDDLRVLAASPVYAALGRHLVTEPELAASLLAAPPTERLPNLLFAAVHFLLRAAPDAALAAYYPSLGGTRPPDAGLIDAFRDFVTAHDTELRALTTTRTTQTNEARRAAMVLPALAAAQRIGGAERPLALVEVGCSSGLMLLVDRYGYRYRQPDGSVLAIPAPAEAPRTTGDVILDVSVRGERRVPDWVATPLRIGSRVGIDRHPIAAGDPAETEWLRACVWPEHTDRLHRLDAALAEAAAARLDLRTGDLLDLLPAAVAEAPAGALVCVLSSHVLPYLTPDERVAFAELATSLAAERDLVLLLNEARAMADVFGVHGLADVPVETVLSATVDFCDLEPAGLAWAAVDPHGAWMEWLA